MSLLHNPICAKCGGAEYTLVGARSGADYYECPLCEHKVDAYVTDETWRKTYPTKPEWWDDPTEPRCDFCGVHTEEACVYVKNPNVNLDRFPGAWCGECGNCADHCTCSASVDEAHWLGLPVGITIDSEGEVVITVDLGDASVADNYDDEVGAEFLARLAAAIEAGDYSLEAI